MVNLILSIFFICSGTGSGYIENLKFMQTKLEQSRPAGTFTHKPIGKKGGKEYPEQATYLAVSSFIFEPRVGVNGFIFVGINAKIPGGETDTNYQDTVDLKVVKEYSVNSVTFYPNVGMGPDTSNPITSVKLYKGEAFIWLKDTKPEKLMFWAIPRDSLKPSHPVVYTIDSSGTIPARVEIEGPRRVSAGEMTGRYLVRVVDNSGKVITGGTFMDPASVKIKVIEEVADSSALLWDLFTGEGTSVNCCLLSGQANIFLSASVPEHLTLVAEHNFGLAPDTFKVTVVAGNEASSIMPISFSGTYGTKGVDKSILTMAFAPDIDGPDPNNSSSQVKLVSDDIMGTQSVEILPSEPQTLMGGIATFTLKNSEADSGVIIHTVCSGIPELSPSWWFGSKIAYGFKEPGEAVLMHPSGPNTAIVGDTITVFVYAVDGMGSLDTNYNGWVSSYIDEDANSSCEILDYETGLPCDIFHIQNGVGRVWITNSEVEEITCEFEDAEGGFPMVYLGSSSPFGSGISISFEEPGDSATQWVLELPGYPGGNLPARQLITGTIKAVDNSDRVDTAFQDSARFKITGFATPETALVPVTKGIGVIEFKNDSVEKVEITVSGGNLTMWSDSVSFIPSDKACWLVVLAPEGALVSDSLKCILYAMNQNFGIDNSWNGVAKIEYTDPGDSSIIWSGNPDTIPIINGVGHITMLNTEVESVQVELKYVSGEPPILPMQEKGTLYFKAKLCVVMPDSGILGVVDTIKLTTISAQDSIVKYTTLVHLWCVEENPDGSVVLNPKDSVQIVDGVGIIEIKDTASVAESVWVYAMSEDVLIEERSTLLGVIVFKPAGIEVLEITPKEFFVNLGSSNPSNRNVIIKYQLPVKSNICLKIYDITGRERKELVSGKKSAGYYTVEWDGKDNIGKNCANGVYFYKFSAGNFTNTRKLILMK